jgi:uncharacterized protein (DUF2141 family)
MKINKKVFTLALLSFSLYAMAQQNKLSISVEGIRSKGNIIIAIYNNDDFGNIDKCYKKAVVNSNKGKCVFSFSDLPIGEYAVIAFHDENNNGILDRNFFGVPAEGIGTYLKATGIPSFQKTKFRLDNNKNITIKIDYK